LRTKPPRKPPPCPKPPRAKLGVDPTTQAAANTTAKTRFMIASPHSRPPDSRLPSNHPSERRLYLHCHEWTDLALICAIVSRRLLQCSFTCGPVRCARAPTRSASTARGAVDARSRWVSAGGVGHREIFFGGGNLTNSSPGRNRSGSSLGTAECGLNTT